MCHEIGQESGVRKKRPPRSDPFDVECLVSDRPSALAETFTATDGSAYMEMTDGVNFRHAFWSRHGIYFAIDLSLDLAVNLPLALDLHKRQAKHRNDSPPIRP